MTYGYLRVSTDKQTTENQRFEIQNFAERHGFAIDEWVVETVGSAKDLQKRKLGRLIKKVARGDLIIASELSRLGRNLMQVMGILNILLNIGAKVWTIKDNYRLGDDIPSKVLAFAFGLSAEIERKMISQRTKEALARVRAGGKILGRPVGRKSVKLKLTGRTDLVRRLLADGYSRTAAARKLRVHRLTLSAFAKREGIWPHPGRHSREGGNLLRRRPLLRQRCAAVDPRLRGDDERINGFPALHDSQIML